MCIQPYRLVQVVRLAHFKSIILTLMNYFTPWPRPPPPPSRLAKSLVSHLTQSQALTLTTLSEPFILLCGNCVVRELVTLIL